MKINFAFSDVATFCLFFREGRSSCETAEERLVALTWNLKYLCGETVTGMRAAYGIAKIITVITYRTSEDKKGDLPAHTRGNLTPLRRATSCILRGIKLSLFSLEKRL